MFRKIMSNIAFSPALVGQLSFYANRLKKEEATRRIGLFFTILALIVQSFAVFQPPESANAANSSDMISGGVDTLPQYLAHYDRNTNNIKDIYNSLGITRAEIASTKPSSINSKGGYLSWGMKPQFSAAQGEGKYTFSKDSGSTGSVYYRPLKLWDSTSYTKANGSTYKAFVGNSAKIGWFALILNCGNLVTKAAPPPPQCPAGQIGTWPNCSNPKCPSGTTGTPPNCHKPSTPPPAPNPIASCDSLDIHQIGKIYSVSTNASASGGATIKSYSYVVKKNGSVMDNKTISSNQVYGSYQVGQLSPGSYTITSTVDTSLGQKSGSGCVKSFTVSAPEVCPFNPNLPKDSSECQPCPGDNTVWIKDVKCTAELVQTKKAINITHGGVDATTVVAKDGDQIAYTLTIENKGNQKTSTPIEENLKDVLEYATVVDSGSGVMNNEARSLSWPTTEIEPGTKQTRMFVVKLTDPIPAMTQGRSDKTSYDCIMTNTFGNTVSIAVDCPAPKIVEQTISQLPQTGPTENMIFAGITLTIVTYFYARSRQMKKEVRLIRRDLNAGAV